MRKVPWGRLLAEGATIVSGILLAFWIQASWEGRRESEERTALLASLATDFELAAEELARRVADNVRGRDAAAALLQISLIPSESSGLAPRVDTLLSYVVIGGTFDPPLGAVSAILGSGDLNLLDDPDLVSELTAWPGRLSDLQRLEDTLGEEITATLRYLGSNRVDVSNLSWDNPNAVPWTLHHTAAFELLDDPELRSLLGNLWWYHRNKGRKHEELVKSRDTIRRLLASDRSAL